MVVPRKRERSRTACVDARYSRSYYLPVMRRSHIAPRVLAPFVQGRAGLAWKLSCMGECSGG